MIRFIIAIKITITFLSRLKHLVHLLTVKERFYCALGPAYYEFSYNEQPDIMSKFLGNKIIDSNINKFSYNGQFPLHLSTRCRRGSVYIHYSTMNTAIVLAHRYDNILFVILFQYSNHLHRLISCAPIFKVILVVLILLWWQDIANTGRWRPSVY